MDGKQFGQASLKMNENSIGQTWWNHQKVFPPQLNRYQIAICDIEWAMKNLQGKSRSPTRTHTHVQCTHTYIIHASACVCFLRKFCIWMIFKYVQYRTEKQPNWPNTCNIFSDRTSTPMFSAFVCKILRFCFLARRPFPFLFFCLVCPLPCLRNGK